MIETASGLREGADVHEEPGLSEDLDVAPPTPAEEHQDQAMALELYGDDFFVF